MKRRISKFFSILLVICMVVSMIPAAVFAASTPSVLYFKPNGNWLADSARFAAYFFEGDANTWVSMTDADGDGYYEANVPSGYSGVIFCRMNGSAADNNWDNKWNQTGDLALPTDGTNCWTLDDGMWDYGSGSWSAYAPAVDYYLFGYINGANYACEEDSANLGSYLFSNGTLTTTFSCDSYVAVKTGDNAKWYMTDGYPGDGVSSATLYNTNVGIDANKLYVPGGVKVTFTLTVNASADTLTLSYTVDSGSCSHLNHDTSGKCTACGSSVSHSYSNGTCSVCGLVCGHTWSNGTCTVCGTTCSHNWVSGKCTTCGLSCSHSYNSGTVTTAATCSTAGVKTYTCTVCGSTKTESIAATGHNYVSTVTAPTCTASGYTTYTCSKCGDSYTGNTTAATGHNYVNGACTYCGDGCSHSYDSGTVTKAATCTATGVKTYTCTICGGTKTETIAATGHSYTSKVTAPTCTEGGYTTYTCSKCGDSYTGNTTSATGHSYNSGEITTAATCTATGVKTYTCTVCGTTKTETIAAIDHTYSGGSCTVCGGTDPDYVAVYYLFGYINGGNYACEEDSANTGTYKFTSGKLTATFDCDSYVAVKTGDNINWYMTDGYPGDGVSTATLYNTNVGIDANKLYVPGGVEVTFTLTVNTGSDTLTLSYSVNASSCAHLNHSTDGVCTACGGSVSHSFTDGTCTVCGLVCTHSWNSGTTTTAATCTTAGVKTYTCTVCGSTKTEEIAATGHSYNSGEITTAATCSTAGVKTYTCSNCGGTKTETIAATGHSYTSTVTAPTCAEGGYTTYTCSKCGGSYTGDATAATGHSYSNGSCTVCGAEDPDYEIQYYLFGYINGGNYACEEDSANTGIYKFTNGKLTATFDCDSFVCVKTGDNANWYMTDGYDASATTVTLYNTSSGIAEPNKMFVPGGVEVVFTLTVNASADTLTLSYTVNSDSCPHSSHSTSGVCSTCGATVSHTYTDGSCSVCGLTCSHPTHNTTGVCSTCGTSVGHSFTGNTCTVCGLTCSHSWSNGTCTVCGETCGHSSHSTSGVCSTCGATVSHTYSSGKCSVCGLSCSHASHSTSGVCTTCGSAVEHTYSSGKCTVCGATEDGGIRIHFVDSLGWEGICAYPWIVSGSTTSALGTYAWPGVVINRDSDGFYLLELDYTPTSGQSLGILFHDFAGNQTADLTISYSTMSVSKDIWVMPTSTTDSDGKYPCTVAVSSSSLLYSPVVSGNQVTFRYRNSSASTVYLAGSMNDWSTSANALTKGSDGVFTLTMTLDPGIYEYKYIVDGSWITDPANGYVGGYDGNSIVQIPTGETSDDKITVKLHYYRSDEDYDGWDAWLWSATASGAGYTFEEDTVNKGVVATITLDGSKNSYLNYIIRQSDWSSQEFSDRSIDLSDIASGTVHYYVNSGSYSGYRVLENDVVMVSKLSYANLDYDSGKVWVKTSLPVTGDPSSVFSIVTSSGAASGITVTSAELSGWGYSLTLSRKPTLNELYDLYVKYGEFTCSIGISDGLFYTSAFANDYTYYGDDLGATWSATSTTFKVWAPTAKKVSVMLYQGGNSGYSDWISTVEMTLGECGVWEVTISGDWNGKYYNYLVDFGTYTTEAVDPYADSGGIDGNRGMILDLDSTDPDGWDEDISPNQGMSYTDAIIYELHVREYTIDSSSGVSDSWKGKFLGLTQSGTSYNGYATGLDYLKELGVTHVQLMPIYDHNYGDEYWGDYSWGYDVKNYNMLEGMYSTNASDGSVRVNEFKQMVQTFHENGINVVVDVVFNHTADGGSFCYNKIVPNYFSRFWGDGSWSNGSGCGNDLATEHEMTRNYIVDSIMFYVEEYHIDGFRFDLVGLIDTQTINEIVNTVHAKYPYVMFYGEGWAPGDTAVEYGYSLTTQGNAWMVSGFSFFNDSIRNAIAGDNGSSWGFASGSWDYEDAIANYFRASNGWSTTPTQTINYVACHDNYCLTDKLCISRNGAYWEELVKMNRLSGAIVMMAQGTPFIYSGDELLREKKDSYGNRYDNGYGATDEVSKIYWSDLVNKTYAADTAEYYAGLVEFRKNHSALRCSNGSDAWNYVSYYRISDQTIMFYVSGYPNYECSDGIVIIFNASSDTQWVNLYDYGIPSGSWQACIHGDQAGITPLWTVDVTSSSGSVGVEGISTTVLVLGDLVDENSIYNQQSQYINCEHEEHTIGGLCTNCGATVDHTYVSGSCSVCGLSQSAPSTYTVYYDNSTTGWSSVYAYAWTKAGTTTEVYTSTWPGSAMTLADSANNIYSIELPVGAENVIFSGDSSQSSDLTLPGYDSSLNMYDPSTSAWVTYEAACTHPSHNTSGVCTTCGSSVNHTYSNGACTVCGSTCTHSWSSGTCTVCGQTCAHADHDTSGACTTCGSSVNHTYSNGSCTVCGKSCTHSWSSGTCTVCGQICAHASHSTSGVCTTCGSSVNHTYSNGSCTVCGKTCTHSWSNGACSSCGEICAHADHSTSGVCTTCGSSVSHTYSNGSCTVCGNSCTHSWSEGVCILCSTACTHDSHDQDGVCDTCGSTVEHNYSAVTTAATCVSYASTCYTCSVCGYSYTVTDGEWSETQPEGVAASSIETKQQYRYSDYETTTSSRASDVTAVTNWTQTGTGTITYVESWPSGFDTSHSLYTVYNNTPMTGSVTDTEKTVIDSTEIVGYIYYHWCDGSDISGGPWNRWSYAAKTSGYETFDAFFSTTDPSTLTASSDGDGSYTYANADCCLTTYWFFCVPVYQQTYTTYEAVTTYYHWSDWSSWSDTVYTASSTRKVESRTLYRNASATLADHVYDDGAVTTAATCTSTGVMTYTCITCGGTKTETIAQTGHDYAAAVTAPTCTEQGYTTYTCGNCNDSYAADYVDALGHSYVNGTCSVCGAADPDYVSLFTLVGSNMVLGSDLDMNFFFNMTDISGTDGYVVITHYDLEEGEKTYTIAYADWSTYGPYYMVTLDGLAARQMADTIEVVVYNGDGTAISEVWTDSIRAYALRSFASSTQTDEGRTLLVDMLNYGAAAQEFFSYNTGDLANSTLTDEQKAYATDTVSVTDQRVKGDSYVGSSLVLKSRIMLTVLFDNLTTDMYAIVTYTDHTGEAHELTIPGTDFTEYGGYYGVMIDELVVADGNQLVTVTIYNANGTVVGSASDSMNSYAARSMGSYAIYEMVAKFTTSAYAYFH